MAFPKALVTRFFQLNGNRQFAEAERELKRLKARITRTEWNLGYYRALRGMLLARKANGNQYTFLSNINPEDRETLEQHRKAFLRHVQSRFHDEFDRGFFSAWSDYMLLLINSVEEHKPEMDPEGQTNITQYVEPIQASQLG